jgi:hypothetical protein
VRPPGGAFAQEPLGVDRVVFGGDLDVDPRTGHLVAAFGGGPGNGDRVVVTERTP